MAKNQKPASKSLRVAEPLRLALVAASAEQRAAHAELHLAQAQARDVIKKFDKDGAIEKALQAIAAQTRAVEVADLKYQQTVIAVERSVGKSLSAHVMNGETGELTTVQRPTT